MMAVIGRPREFDGDAALEAAMLVFWRKGYSATSMTDLCDAMGIRSPSLYAAFGSKEALYLAAIDHYVREVGPPVWNSLAEGNTGRDSVQNFLIAGTTALPQSGAVPAGCMAMLAAVGDEWPIAIADVASRIRNDCLENLQSRLGAAVAAGELPGSLDISRLSRFYLGVFQGMAIQARDGATAADLRGIAETAMDAWPAQDAAI